MTKIPRQCRILAEAGLDPSSNFPCHSRESGNPGAEGMFDPIFSLLFLAAIASPITAIIYWLRSKRRPARSTRIAAIVYAIAGPAAFILYAGPVMFVSNKDATTVYILTPEAKSDKFTDDLGSIVRRQGFSESSGKSTDDRQQTYYVMNGSGHWLWLWSTNMPLSANDAPDICGKYTEGHPDPGQYILTLSPFFPFRTKTEAQEYMSKITRGLQVIGYEVRAKPAICSPLSKLRAQH
jgi:hypothetical protein